MSYVVVTMELINELLQTSEFGYEIKTLTSLPNGTIRVDYTDEEDVKLALHYDKPSLLTRVEREESRECDFILSKQIHWVDIGEMSYSEAKKAHYSSKKE